MKKSTIVFLISIIAVVFIGLMVLISILSIFLGDTDGIGGNVAVIPVKGVILSEGDGGLFGGGIASSTEIVRMIEKADDNSRIKAIVLEINSPGGSAVASDEIGMALKRTNKTKVAWIREVGASGGYWIASTCDVIIANRMSITGSIGVISSYLEFSEFLDDYNITYQRLVSGKYKDTGSPYKELTEEEKSILQGQLDSIHEFFIDEVATNRNLPKERARELATGIIYIGAEAKELGLVDILGGKDEVTRYIRTNLDIEPDFVRYKSKESLLDSLSGVMYKSYFAYGRGLAFQMTKKDPYSILLLS